MYRIDIPSWSESLIHPWAAGNLELFGCSRTGAQWRSLGFITHGIFITYFYNIGYLKISYCFSKLITLQKVQSECPCNYPFLQSSLKKENLNSNFKQLSWDKETTFSSSEKKGFEQIIDVIGIDKVSILLVFCLAIQSLNIWYLRKEF